MSTSAPASICDCNFPELSYVPSMDTSGYCSSNIGIRCSVKVFSRLAAAASVIVPWMSAFCAAPDVSVVTVSSVLSFCAGASVFVSAPLLLPQAASPAVIAVSNRTAVHFFIIFPHFASDYFYTKLQIVCKFMVLLFSCTISGISL